MRDAARFLRLALSLSGLVVLGWVVTGYAAKPSNHGIPLPTDWSHQHLIFSRPRSAEQLTQISHDPRYEQQKLRRGEALMLPAVAAYLSAGPFGAGLLKRQGNKLNAIGRTIWAPAPAQGRAITPRNSRSRPRPQTAAMRRRPITWSTARACQSTGLPGSATQASIVAYDNIYAGCNKLNLRTAGSFAVLGSSTVTNAGDTVVTRANIGASPGTSLTGFPPVSLLRLP